MTHAKWADRKEREVEVVSANRSTCAHLFITDGLERKEVNEAGAGNIVWFSGPEEITLGDSVSDPSFTDTVLPPLDIEEPTVSMFFLVNTSPFAGEEGDA